MSLSFIRRYFCVPAKRGVRVRHKHSLKGILRGKISISKGGLLYVKFDGLKRSTPINPLEIEYLDSKSRVIWPQRRRKRARRRK